MFFSELSVKQYQRKYEMSMIQKSQIVLIMNFMRIEDQLSSLHPDTKK